MTDRAYIVSRTLENKIVLADNNDQNAMLVTLDVLKEILVILKEQEDEIRQLRLALQIMNGNGIRVDTEGKVILDRTIVRV